MMELGGMTSVFCNEARQGWPVCNLQYCASNPIFDAMDWIQKSNNKDQSKR
jgi:hypothetical protein